MCGARTAPLLIVPADDQWFAGALVLALGRLPAGAFFVSVRAVAAISCSLIGGLEARGVSCTARGDEQSFPGGLSHCWAAPRV